MVGIFEDEMASINGILPGSKKSVPYMVEASEYPWFGRLPRFQLISRSHFLVEDGRAEQGEMALVKGD